MGFFFIFFSHKGVTYILQDTNSGVSCCGSVESWTFYPKRSGSIYLQIWRPVTESSYKLIGYNYVYIHCTSEFIHFFTQNINKLGFLIHSFVVSIKILLLNEECVKWRNCHDLVWTRFVVSASNINRIVKYVVPDNERITVNDGDKMGW